MGGAGLGTSPHLVPRPDPLGRYAQDLGHGGGPHRQTAVQKKPASARVADPAQIFGLAMSGEVQLAGILHKQNGVGLRRLLTRGLPMRLMRAALVTSGSFSKR